MGLVADQMGEVVVFKFEEEEKFFLFKKFFEN